MVAAVRRDKLEIDVEANAYTWKTTRRMYPLRPHPVQLALVQSPARFKMVPAGRRSGKTERAKRRLIKALFDCHPWSVSYKKPEFNGVTWDDPHYFAAAPTRDQAKRIWWADLKRMIHKDYVRSISESELTITTKWGASLSVVGLDKPERMEGSPWDGGVIDEFASCFVAETLVDTPNGPKAIETFVPGDCVNNATGFGVVRATFCKTTKRVVNIGAGGYSMVCTEDHRFFTARGWVEARQLVKGDQLIEQNEALRILRDGLRAPRLQEGWALVLQSKVFGKPEYQTPGHGHMPGLPKTVSNKTSSRSRRRDGQVLFYPMLPQRLGVSRNENLSDLQDTLRGNKGDRHTAFLFSELFREMENGSTCNSASRFHGGTSAEVAGGTSSLLGQRYTRGFGSQGCNTGTQQDAHSGGSGEGHSNTSSHGPRFRQEPAGKRNRFNETTSKIVGSPGFGVPPRVLRDNGTRAENQRPTPALSDRYCVPDQTVGNRGGRPLAQKPKETNFGRAKNADTGNVRVDSVEVLESGDRRFFNLSGGKDTIRVYDLEISTHPTFSVNGFLVHNCKEKAWQANILPALSDRNAWVWLIGVPDFDSPGQVQYKKIVDAIKSGDPDYKDWACFSWPSKDIVDPKEIADRMRTMDPLLFAQEYGGDFVLAGGLAFSSFDLKLHVNGAEAVYDHNLPICISWDFNVNPFCFGVLQHDKKKGVRPRVIHEFRLADSDTNVACNAFLEWYEKLPYKPPSLHIYGDASGNARDSTSGQTDWAIIQKALKNLQPKFNIPSANPPVKDTVNAVRARLKNAAGEIGLVITPQATRLISDLQEALWPDDLMEQHSLAWLRYFVSQEYFVGVSVETTNDFRHTTNNGQSRHGHPVAAHLTSSPRVVR